MKMHYPIYIQFKNDGIPIALRYNPQLSTTSELNIYIPRTSFFLWITKEKNERPKNLCRHHSSRRFTDST